MPQRSSELVEISKLNGDFKKNYGKLLGAFLYRARSALYAVGPLAWFTLAAAAVMWLLWCCANDFALCANSS
jgi:hypothetical protein